MQSQNKVTRNKIEINYKYCGAGGECISVCPFGEKIWQYKEVEFDQFLKGRVKKMRPVPVNTDLCTGCGRCASFCPVGAIAVNGKGQRPVIVALVSWLLHPEKVKVDMNKKHIQNVKKYF